MNSFDAKRPEYGSYGFACELWTPSKMPRPDRHNEIELNYILSGTITYLLGGRKIVVQSDNLAVFWAAIPHQVISHEGNEPYYVLTLPLSEFLGVGIDLEVANRVLQGEMLVDEVYDPCDKLKFESWAKDLNSNTVNSQRTVRWEVQARLLRLTSRISDSPVNVEIPTLNRADQLACYMAKNYHLPLTSQSIAEANQLNPNYAMNLFRKAFGTTMTAFITKHRITHAQRLLVTTNNSILNVALDSGFQSLSRFNEAFKAACGCTPTNYRKTHRQYLKHR